ncbi:MAG: hypothetical protein LBQ97_08780 [Fusobacteriaceae bacterium]|jgi:hypothetical protein|nr:hypothetical protein [Fusobacteriaceae bacterium]
MGSPDPDAFKADPDGPLQDKPDFPVMEAYPEKKCTEKEQNDRYSVT